MKRPLYIIWRERIDKFEPVFKRGFYSDDHDIHGKFEEAKKHAIERLEVKINELQVKLKSIRETNSKDCAMVNDPYT